MQFRQFGQQHAARTAAHHLRHLRRRVQDGRFEGRGDGLEKRHGALPLTDGTSDAWAYGICVDNGTVYTAGYEEQDGHIVAVLWENATLKYTLGASGSNSYALAVTVSDGTAYTAGSTTVDGSLTATVWENGSVLHTYSVSPATSQARAVAVSDGKVYAAGNLQTGGTQPVA